MAAIPVIIVAVLALVLGIGREDVASQAGPLASPVPSPDLGSGARPPDVVIARADGVEVHIPVDPQRVTATAFHAINDPSGVAMEASGALHIQQSGRDGRAGPDTAALDVGAPAGTAVYAPVDGDDRQRERLHGARAGSRGTRSRSPPRWRPPAWCCA